MARKNPVLVPFEMWHFSQFTNRDGDHEANPPQVGPAYTAILDGRILGCAGINVGVLHGVGIAWASFSAELMEKYSIWTTRMVKRVLEDAKRYENIRYLELVVRQDSKTEKRNMRWAEALGFVEEGTYTHYQRKV